MEEVRLLVLQLNCFLPPLPFNQGWKRHRIMSSIQAAKRRKNTKMLHCEKGFSVRISWFLFLTYRSPSKFPFALEIPISAGIRHRHPAFRGAGW